MMISGSGFNGETAPGKYLQFDLILAIGASDSGRTFPAKPVVQAALSSLIEM